MRTAMTILMLFATTTAVAGPIPGRLAEWSMQSNDLDLPTKPSSFSFSRGPQLSVYRPPGEGPFPALVLQHQCGGLNNSKSGWQNRSMLDRAKKAVERGYVVLLMDSLGPRGVNSVCKGFRKGVNWGRGLKDVLRAAAHLRSLDYVDKNRVALAGFSWGATIGLLSSIKDVRDELDAGGNLRGHRFLLSGLSHQASQASTL